METAPEAWSWEQTPVTRYSHVSKSPSVILSGKEAALTLDMIYCRALRRRSQTSSQPHYLTYVLYQPLYPCRPPPYSLIVIHAIHTAPLSFWASGQQKRKLCKTNAAKTFYTGTTGNTRPGRQWRAWARQTTDWSLCCGRGSDTAPWRQTQTKWRVIDKLLSHSTSSKPAILVFATLCWSGLSICRSDGAHAFHPSASYYTMRTETIGQTSNETIPRQQ